MPKKTKKKRLKRRGAKPSPRIVTADFRPAGSEAELDKAIACFGKIPTQRLKITPGSRPYDLDFQGIDQIRSIRKGRDLCTKIGVSYALSCALRQTHISPGKALANLEAVKTAAGMLAAALVNLGPQERLMLNTFDDLNDHPQLDELAAQFNKVDPEDLPDRWLAEDGQVPTGDLANQLLELVRYLGLLISIRARQLKRPRTGKAGLKINRTAVGLFSAPPEWQLIDKCWRLFSSVNLGPTSTKGGAVHRFARHIHTWVTGRTDSLEHHFRRYATVRLSLDETYKEFDSAAKLLGRSRRELEVDCEHNQRRDLDTQAFEAAKVTWAKIQNLENDILFGT